MKTRIQRLHQYLPLRAALSVPLLSALIAVCPSTALASGSASARITAEVTSSRMTPLKPSQRAMALAPFDTGKLAETTRFQGMTIHFNRTPAQEADMQTLMAAQQNPSSPLYHQWLTPEQYGARFGMSDADIAKVETWLEQQGFSIDSVERGKTAIRFSGTAGQANAAFATEIHTYAIKTRTGVEQHFAPSTTLSVPSAIAGVVESVGNLDNFRPKPHFAISNKARIKPNYTLNLNGTSYIFFAPGDISEEYDLNPEYKAGFDGDGQSITIVGQSEIENSDIEAFQNAAGLPVKDPTLYLIPNTGSAAFSAGDWTESSLDIEWSGAIAKGATINFVYTGNAANTGGAFDAIQYAIDQKIGTVISSSYGDCEADLDGSSLETYFTRAAMQGQTVMSAAGDDGSTDCYADYVGGYVNLQTGESLQVDYPGSSPNVTSVGGTEISQANSAYETPGDGYFEAENTTGNTILTSLQQFVPEQAWNEDPICIEYYSGTGSPLCSGGGGASTLFAKPSWQTGVPGLSSSITMREVPDIALAASIYNPGYVFCTSDQSAWQNGQAASCNDGFLDRTSLDPTAAGGTSFATPIFAGMVAILNQQKGYTTGQGLVNTTLYKLASNSTTYASAFHDIGAISGSTNACENYNGSSYCSSAGESGFATTTGYDEATGLGSIDLANLAGVWPENTGTTLIATTTSVTAANSAPTINVSDNFTISVTSATGSTVPTGTVKISVDGGTAVTETLTSNGTYVYATSFTTAGTHTVTVDYSGDSTHASSSGSATITAAGTTSGTGSFTLTSTNLTVSDGNSGSSTITAKPSGGYTGTIDLSLDTSNDSALQNICWSYSNSDSSGDGIITVTSAASQSTTVTIYTSATYCAEQAAVRKSGKNALHTLPRRTTASNTPKPGTGKAPLAAALAGLLFAGYLGRYSRKFRSLAGVIALVAIGLGVSACGSNSGSSLSNPPTGSYMVTITGQDSANASIPSTTTTFTFTIN